MPYKYNMSKMKKITKGVRKLNLPKVTSNVGTGSLPKRKGKDKSGYKSRVRYVGM